MDAHKLRALQAASLVIALVAFGSRLAAESNDSASDGADRAPMRIWTVKFVDAQTRKPLAGIMADTRIAVSNQKDQQEWLLISDDAGQAKISLRKGQCTSLNVRGPGWCCGSGVPVVGDVPPELNQKQQQP